MISPIRKVEDFLKRIHFEILTDLPFALSFRRCCLCRRKPNGQWTQAFVSLHIVYIDHIMLQHESETRIQAHTYVRTYHPKLSGLAFANGTHRALRLRPQEARLKYAAARFARSNYPYILNICCELAPLVRSNTNLDKTAVGIPVSVR